MKRFSALLAVLALITACAAPSLGKSSEPVGKRCADTVIRQVTSAKAVPGSFACLAGGLADRAAQMGIKSDQDLADAIGHDGTWEYVGRAHDGAFVYAVTEAGSLTGYVVGVDARGKVVSVG